MDYKKIAEMPCKGGTCPTVYQESETGDYVVQGYVMADDVRVQLSVPNGEGIVRVPAVVINELTRAIRAELS